MLHTPEVTAIPAQLTAQIPLTVPCAQIREVMGPGIMEIYSALAAQGIAPAGPWFTHHLRVPTDTFDFEICVPVSTPVTPVGRVIPGELPAARVARAVYQGPYEDLGNAWAELMQWIDAQGLNPRADLWEVYEKGPESGDDASEYRTVLHRPLPD